MRRLVVLLMAVAIALTALTGVAMARTINGTSGDDTIFGTPNRDVISAGEGDDRVFGLRGGDQITGGPGNDILAGNAGNDRFFAQDGEADVISCGSGFDVVFADSLDTFEDRVDCERVKVDDDTTPPGGEEGTDCSDNIDNDGDGSIDFPEDTGCSGPEDNTETPGTPPGDGGIDCDDGLDNDGDGDTDFPGDTGCESATDPLETGGGDDSQCDDGVDNDGDGKVDFPADPGCSSGDDDTEGTDGGGDDPQCEDGIDNDGDGQTDYPDDLSCGSPDDDNEGDGGTICHKPDTPAEKTKTLPESALKGHYGHGDTPGPCDGDDSDNRSQGKSRKHN